MVALIDGVKACSACKEDKPLSEFHKDKNSPTGSTYYCKLCANSKGRAHHANRVKNNPEAKRKKRNNWINQVHGISVDEYETKLEAQGSICAICKVPLLPSGGHTHLDHDHMTGKLRDFLCTNCNRGLGHFQDNPVLLSFAKAYLERHQ